LFSFFSLFITHTFLSPWNGEDERNTPVKKVKEVKKAPVEPRALPKKRRFSM